MRRAILGSVILAPVLLILDYILYFAFAIVSSEHPG
jgi:hypothetical protein